MLSFAIIFMAVGFIIPYMYIRYIDQTNYYTLYSIATTRNEYSPCDSLTLHFHRTALLNMPATMTFDLRKKNDGQITYQHTQFEQYITQGQREFDDATFKLDCSLQSGTYFYYGQVKYKINSVDKSTPFQTNDFVIK